LTDKRRAAARKAAEPVTEDGEAKGE